MTYIEVEEHFTGQDALMACKHILETPERRARVMRMIFSISRDDIQLYVSVTDANVLVHPDHLDDPIAPVKLEEYDTESE